VLEKFAQLPQKLQLQVVQMENEEKAFLQLRTEIAQKSWTLFTVCFLFLEAFI